MSWFQRLCSGASTHRKVLVLDGSPVEICVTSGVASVLAGWSPYAGLTYFNSMLNRLAEAGFLGQGLGS